MDQTRLESPAEESSECAKQLYSTVWLMSRQNQSAMLQRFNLSGCEMGLDKVVKVIVQSSDIKRLYKDFNSFVYAHIKLGRSNGWHACSRSLTGTVGYILTNFACAKTCIRG